MRLLLSLAVLALPGVALADPPNLKPLAIGSPAPDFKLPGVDGREYTLASFRDAKVWSLPSPATIARRRTRMRLGSRNSPTNTRPRAWPSWRSRPTTPRPSGSTSWDTPTSTTRSKSMKIRAKDHAFNFPYLYDGETQATSRGLWRPGHAPCLHLRRRPQASLSGAVRRLGSQDREVARRDQRGRGDSRGLEGCRRDHPGPRLLDQVGRQAGERPQVARRRPTPSRSARHDRRGGRGRSS